MLKLLLIKKRVSKLLDKTKFLNLKFTFIYSNKIRHFFSVLLRGLFGSLNQYFIK